MCIWIYTGVYALNLLYVFDHSFDKEMLQTYVPTLLDLYAWYNSVTVFSCNFQLIELTIEMVLSGFDNV